MPGRRAYRRSPEPWGSLLLPLRAPARGSWRTYPPTGVCAAPGSALRSAPSQVLHALSLPSSPRPGTPTAAASSRGPGVPVKSILSTLAGPCCTPSSSPGPGRSERNTKRPSLALPAAAPARAHYSSTPLKAGHLEPSSSRPPASLPPLLVKSIQSSQKSRERGP